ncbi:tetratricopeptide repeat protein 31-like isoform X2 [Solea senegalensis]|uniref:Tetratricopeptide repeat protein 31-like isoform X2 n=1 Tax=Solea senegalensis TaxID=28829 RepID=A0AAV6QST6_SOLSE|nr:tetratricopeptide repeat protein 31-like isoform X2 [Solea senegalensis]
MDMYRDETEFTDMEMIQTVVGMFENNRHMQRIVRYGLLGLEYEDEDTVDYDDWVHEPHNFHGCQRLSDAMGSDRFRGNTTRSSHSVFQHPIHYYIPPHEPPLSARLQSKESDAERNARLLEEVKQNEEKAQKKRLKKQKQKKRKQLEKEKQNAVKSEEGKTDVQQSDTGESKAADKKSKDDKSSSVDQLALGKDTDGSEDETDGDGSDKDGSFDSEDLDMTSTFVTKAALIVKRKLEQKPQHENKEKKTPVKECKTVPEKAKEKPEVEKKDSAAHSIPTIEDNIRISTELAVIGNKFASSGDFNMAVKYFTNAIKYNPTEFKLFGNRSFCFEKMQVYEKALADAELCLNMCPGWIKGLFRKGRALAGLKRYEEAAQAFNEVLRLESSYAEAAQELMRVQIMQLMEYGFTREQSSNALIIHGTVKKALAVLSTLNHQPGANYNALPPAQVVNVTGVSPVLSANTNPAAAAAAPPPHPSLSQDAPTTSLKHKPLGPIQNMSNVQNHLRPAPNMTVKSSNENSQPPPELFPVWVGNLYYPVSDSVLTNLFNKAGDVYSVKVLAFKRCAFVNFTKQEFCDEAIRKFHGFELNGMKIAVRYPDRIPYGMGISRSALRADDLQNESVGQYTLGGRRPVRPQRCEYRDNDKN